MPKKLTPRQKAGRENRKKRGDLTPEGREALSQAAHANKPWLHSTGPKTSEGKRRSRGNAWRHGAYTSTCLPPLVKEFVGRVHVPHTLTNEHIAYAADYFSQSPLDLKGPVRFAELMLVFCRNQHPARV